MSTINVNIKSSSDKKFIIAIQTDKTVLDLKTAIAEQTQVPAERQRLIYSGRVLKDHDTLADYKIADGNTVHMVKGSQPGAPKGIFNKNDVIMNVHLILFFIIIIISCCCCCTHYDHTHYTHYTFFYNHQCVGKPKWVPRYAQ